MITEKIAISRIIRTSPAERGRRRRGPPTERPPHGGAGYASSVKGGTVIVADVHDREDFGGQPERADLDALLAGHCRQAVTLLPRGVLGVATAIEFLGALPGAYRLGLPVSRVGVTDGLEVGRN